MNLPPPPGTTGDTRLIRVGLPLLRQDDRDCPRGLALRARPLVVQDGGRVRHKPVNDFALGPVMDVLDLMEHGRKKQLQDALADQRAMRNCHPGHRRWTEEAVRNYLAARAEHEARSRAEGGPATFPAEHDWVTVHNRPEPDARGAKRYELTAWGRRYASADGALRELWLPSVNKVKQDRPPAEIVAAAAVAAFGDPATFAFGEPYYVHPEAGPRPQRVRVIGVGCGDGSKRVLADWDVQEVSRRYSEFAKPVLEQVVGRTARVPGSDCVRCEGLTGCSEPPRTPGLLGAPALKRPRKRRSVSVSDLRAYAECPASFHLTRVLKLKEGRPENPAIRRGRAVDAALNERHLTRRARGCRDLSLPDELPGLGPDEQAPALRMLAQHRSVCPLDGLGPDEEVRVQRRVTAYDPELDVVIIADPDLVFTDAGGRVWRETKTASSSLWEGRSLLATHPQLALAVLLMSADVLGGDRRRSRIELEILYEDDAACEVIDPFDEATVAEARAVVSRLVTPWADDRVYAPAPGRHCAGCEARRWCAEGQAHLEEDRS